MSLDLKPEARPSILYETLRGKYLKDYDNEPSSYHAQTCFRYIVAITDVEKEVPVSFGRKLVAFLIHMLQVNMADSIRGLFEAKYKINCVKTQIASSTSFTLVEGYRPLLLSH